MLTNMYPTEKYPAYGIFIKSQIDSIASLGHDIDLLFIDGRKSIWNYLVAVGHLQRMVRKGDYDLIHAHFGLSGMVACLQQNCLTVVSFCGDDLLGTPNGRGGITFKSRAIVWMGQLTAIFAKRVIVKSRQMLDSLKLASSREKAVVIPNGVDFEMFRPMDKSKTRKVLGLKKDWNYILFPSRPHVIRKRIDLAKEAVNLLKREFPCSDLLVLCGNPQWKVPLFMNACDALILTSDWEGSPNVVKEAMACNLPVVSVDAGDSWEVIEGAAHCYRAERSGVDLADKLKRVLVAGERSDGRSRIGGLELGIVARRVVEIYRSCLGEI